ncbi:alpha,alpha-phosphotrehalase [Sporolactobacillus shoreicorticis]|uniref:Alpha,alpha-phosphotrehalase n=1 Tax=Sporolactobacillus shoreicorticis TaxID=1923877 RepID=A0ABW5RY59_9BACL|nr:alpha,alpha-phosphotrehalase [Sporolactobacillus shoreicorticis]MCO7125070.1 alpha,alpha-phosphotrehalase [Sporolactobacillus shoreicorticis]
MNNEWWKKATIYQIYPKSFMDTNGDGIGDINGVIEKLDYLKKLGVDVLWLTPMYQSPQNDNGYDISDYYSLQPEYGTMEDLKHLFSEAHRRELKIVMDIVVNHTSTEHPWFKAALSSVDNPYRDYYIWRNPSEDGGAPNNWQSKFGGSAWELDKKSGQYYLHLYDVSQADLNWENKAVRDDIYKMMNFWLDQGADGFRLDVINVISKDQRFPDDHDPKSPGDGRPFYTDGPRIHEFLHEMNERVFSRRSGTVTVGEMSSTTVDNCIRYTNPNDKELSMVFNFHHLKVDYPNGQKWALGKLKLADLKKALTEWQKGMHKGGGWNALFWCNHDQPRIVSRFGDEGEYRIESAKMLATTLHMLQGTPYVYQGEEIGMTNPNFQRIDDYRDVESLNAYRFLQNEGKSEKEILAILRQKSRDNGRTPMQWNTSENGGFTTGKPWIEVARNYQAVNAEAALADPNSVFYHYQKLIALRKRFDVIVNGDFQLLLPENTQIFTYLRSGARDRLLVVSNFTGSAAAFSVPQKLAAARSELLISNYSDSPAHLYSLNLRPYESVVYHLEDTMKKFINLPDM